MCVCVCVCVRACVCLHERCCLPRGHVPIERESVMSTGRRFRGRANAYLMSRWQQIAGVTGGALRRDAPQSPPAVPPSPPKRHANHHGDDNKATQNTTLSGVTVSRDEGIDPQTDRQTQTPSYDFFSFQGKLNKIKA